MSSITNKGTQERESDKDVEKGIRNDTDADTLEKGSVIVYCQRIRTTTDEKALRKK